MEKSKNILVGKKEIMEYLGINGSAFKTLCGRGLPVIKDGQYYSHKETIEEFMKEESKKIVNFK